MDIGRKIKEARIAKGLTQEELGEILGVQKSAIAKYENGRIVNIKRSSLKILSDVLGIRPSELIFEKAIDEPSGFVPLPPTERRPVLGRIACGEPILAEQNIEGYADVPEGRGVDFCLICAGDSMIEAGIHDGDLVYIRQQVEVENGEIAAVRIGSDATLKRVYRLPGQLILQAENKKYPPLLYTEGGGEDIQIIGKAVGYSHWF